jgi:hypothetical protein
MISTPSDHAATAGADIRERRPAVPAITGVCPGCWLRFPPTERNATPGSFRERYGSDRQVHDLPVDVRSGDGPLSVRRHPSTVNGASRFLPEMAFGHH